MISDNDLFHFFDKFLAKQSFRIEQRCGRFNVLGLSIVSFPAISQQVFFWFCFFFFFIPEVFFASVHSFTTLLPSLCDSRQQMTLWANLSKSCHWQHRFGSELCVGTHCGSDINFFPKMPFWRQYHPHLRQWRGQSQTKQICPDCKAEAKPFNQTVSCVECIFWKFMKHQHLSVRKPLYVSTWLKNQHCQERYRSIASHEIMLWLCRWFQRFWAIVVFFSRLIFFIYLFLLIIFIYLFFFFFGRFAMYSLHFFAFLRVSPFWVLFRCWFTPPPPQRNNT